MIKENSLEIDFDDGFGYEIFASEEFFSSDYEGCSVDINDDPNLKNCAGGIATGTAVKDGRSIFWKNRHWTFSSSSYEKPVLRSGPVYKYWWNTGTSLGMNEAGLAVGNFAQYGTLYNWHYLSTATYSQTSGIQGYLLGNFATVAEAAFFAAHHMGGKSSLGIISAESGVGAIVYSGVNTAGQQVCTLVWVNNTYRAMSNTYECDGSYDGQYYDAKARLDQSYAKHGFIDWADVIQKAARDVRGREQGTGSFSTSGLVSQANALSSMVAVSGDPRWNGSANIAWICFARQPLVGIYLPLGASYFQSYTDIAPLFRAGNGMEDYVSIKAYYATNGAGPGSNTYYADKVRQVQQYAFQIENHSFLLYDQYIASLDLSMSDNTVKSMLKTYANTLAPQMLAAYMNETFINQTTLTITIDGPGLVIKNPNQDAYDFGQVVTLTAIPNDGWMLSSWSGDLTGAMNPTTITMNGNKAVTAHFSDSSPPQISAIVQLTSDPLDTNSLFGWVNISCIVTDNIGVSQVLLRIQNPDGTWNNVSMQSGGAGQYYYQSSTAFSSAGNYSYNIWAQDMDGNTNASDEVLFSMPANWDINMDGWCTIFDFVLVSNRLNEAGGSGWIREDVDNDGSISLLDLMYLVNHYGQTWW